MNYAKQDRKYFFECGADSKRDLRFADPAICTPEDNLHNLAYAQLSLRALLTSWVKFTRKNHVVWWISHGEMLGWFWNGKLLPWDVDWDIQMSTFQLVQLAVHNGTMIEDRFLIDVNPASLVRTKQESNMIDARIIDTWTGYFVDITGVTFLDKSLMLQDYADEIIGVHAADHTERIQKLNETLTSDTVYCKSIHTYEYDDLIPLYETVVDGLRVWRPKNAVKILLREYNANALVEESYTVDLRKERWAWNVGKKVWELADDEEVEPDTTRTKESLSRLPGANETSVNEIR
ncbi:LicD family-domain-containing protein [Chytriomyces sp. MP71]|nr:LicD family-domain-containing protein [Chytriomyces sp. MP71]